MLKDQVNYTARDINELINISHGLLYKYFHTWSMKGNMLFETTKQIYIYPSTSPFLIVTDVDKSGQVPMSNFLIKYHHIGLPRYHIHT